MLTVEEDDPPAGFEVEDCGGRIRVPTEEEQLTLWIWV